MPLISTRLAMAGDLPAVQEMVHALAAFHGDKAKLDLKTLQRDALEDTPWVKLIIAERSSKILGYVALCPLIQLQFGVRGMDIHHLFVQQDARGQGAGKLLIKASIAQAKAMGCGYIMVGTQTSNVAAQQIYMAAGFSAIPMSGPRFLMKFGSS